MAESPRRQGIVTVGSVHMDVIAASDRLPASGESLLGHSLSIQPGGKAGNQAAQAARLGGQSAIVGRIGDDPFGRALIGHLADVGVITDCLSIDSKVATGASPIFVGSDGDYASIIVPGAAARLSTDDLERARLVFEDASLVMLQLELPMEITVETAKFARSAGCMIMLNASPLSALPCSPNIWPYIDVVVVNLIEARRLVETSRSDALNHVYMPPMQCAHVLREAFGVQRVVVTLGANGVVAIDGKDSLTIPSLPVAVGNAIGAGDALAGALGFGLASACSLFEALPLAVAASAYAVTRDGGGFASYGTLLDVATLMTRYGIPEPCFGRH